MKINILKKFLYYLGVNSLFLQNWWKFNKLVFEFNFGPSIVGKYLRKITTTEYLINISFGEFSRLWLLAY